MAGEAKFTRSTQVTVISRTANVAANGFNTSGEITALTSANHYNYPLAEAVLYASFSAAVSSASNYINFYRRDINVDSTNDSPILQSAAPAYRNQFVGAFQIPPYTSASAGYFSLGTDVPLTAECEFYFENKTNTTLTAFEVKLTPKTLVPGT